MFSDGLTQAPLNQVEVRSRPLGLQGFTDSLGVLQVPIHSPGSFLFEFVKEGYKGLAGVLEISGSDEVLIELDPSNARGGADRSVLSGRVWDAGTNTPLEGVVVSARDTQLIAVTQRDGAFILPNVLPGNYQLGFTRLGFSDRELSLDLSGSQRIVEVVMSTEPIPLDPITVTAERRVIRLEMAGFYQRRSLRLGQFLGPEELEKRTVAKVTDLFNDFHGIRFINKEAGGGVRRRLRSNGDKVWSVFKPSAGSVSRPYGLTMC